jgi:hypothetical protein
VNHDWIAPGLALLGTLLVAALGFYQWKKQNANPNRAANAAARREAYEGLWKRLEAINLELRNTRQKPPSLSDQLHIINEYFIAHSLYFDDADQVIIDKYVSALHRVRSMIDEADNADLREGYRLTGPVNTARLDQLFKATQEMEKHREVIKEKARKVAGTV